mmetsp:Transcript_8085/g.25455  ORF Transcript_8085/g.25455 Transcript_8085/m.25455 type:complete len:216 (-) Transcript_8085:186-833(-)
MQRDDKGVREPGEDALLGDGALKPLLIGDQLPLAHHLHSVVAAALAVFNLHHAAGGACAQHADDAEIADADAASLRRGLAAQRRLLDLEDTLQAVTITENGKDLLAILHEKLLLHRNLGLFFLVLLVLLARDRGPPSQSLGAGDAEAHEVRDVGLLGSQLLDHAAHDPADRGAWLDLDPKLHEALGGLGSGRGFLNPQLHQPRAPAEVPNDEHHV